MWIEQVDTEKQNSKNGSLFISFSLLFLYFKD